MDAVTRQALIVARELDGADWDDVPVEAVAAWARYARPVLRDLYRYVATIADHEDENVDDEDDPDLDYGDCPGSFHFIPADRVDGSSVATCPVCKRFRAAFPLSPGKEYQVERHARKGQG